jgi:hypothetical protein
VVLVAFGLSAVFLQDGIFNASAAFQKTATRTSAPAPAKANKPATTPAPRAQQPVTVLSQSITNADGSITAGEMITDSPTQRTTAELMTDQLLLPRREVPRKKVWKKQMNRENPGSAPGAIEGSQWPVPDKEDNEDKQTTFEPQSPQTLSTQFDGVTGPTETFAFPPDSNGDVGPTQYFVFVNGRIRTFNKTTGIADGVINMDPDVFFNSVMTPPTSGNFTTDPQVRFDRLSSRWFLCMIDVPGGGTIANRVMIAVSDAASNGVISGTTTWTLYQFQGDAALFTDYQSLGVDASALYVGGNMFNTTTGVFVSCKGFVVPKAPLLAGSPATVWAFANIATASAAGPLSPRGVDNYDPANTGPTATGYFVGVDTLSFNLLQLRRVTNPGSLGPAPTMSANIPVTTPLTTNFPLTVPHLGNTLGGPGALDGLDDRLYAAHLRNNRMWTAHNVGVNNTGTTAGSRTRNAARWYELQNISTTPSVRQSGTLFDNTAPNDLTRRHYWIPSIMVSGQGHAALGCSISGTNERINAFTTGRLVGDTLGTLRDGPGTPAGYTSSSTAYNPPGDSGPTRRWGDYSATSLDPKDDMTMWTIQEYCNGTDTYGVRVVKLLAPPPPPTNSASPAAVPLNNPSINVVVTGTAPAGQGFYDPGPNPPAPHTPFNHIAAVGTGVIVNSITFTDATHVTLNISTVGQTSGSKTVTITNPDGQSTTVQILLGPTEAKVDQFTAAGFDDGSVLLSWKSAREVNNLGYNLYREVSGQKTKITQQPIAGSALTVGNGVGIQAGNSYVWSDRPATGFASVSYWLESVDLSGNKQSTGPVTVTRSRSQGAVAKEQSTLLARLGMAQAQANFRGSSLPQQPIALSVPTSVELEQQRILAASPAVKISVRHEGWHQISQSDLLAVGLAGTSNPRLLQLYLNVRQVPMVVNGELDGRFDPADSIEFYGTGLDTPSSDRRVYWLVNGSAPGLRIKPVRGSGGTPAPASFQYTIERKDRTIYFSALRNGDTENFFGPVINSAGADQAMTVSKLASAPSPAMLEVSAQGVTVGAHQVRVQVNGFTVGTLAFSDQSLGKASFQVQQSRLREGDNVVRLTAIGGSGDISLVDKVRITYWHSYNAAGNELSLRAAAGQEVSIGGFTTKDVRVFDVTDPFVPVEYTVTASGGKGGGNSIRFTVTGSGQRALLAMTRDRFRTAAAVEANVPSSWRHSGGPADMLLITRRELAGAVNPLVLLRQSQGLSVAVIDVDDLYDEFNFGNKSPQAVKDFVDTWLSTWKSKPRFLLFVGDASHDPRNYLGFGDLDLVPSRLLDTAYMEAPSDDWFADEDGDGIPELAVGRLPARNPGEAATMVARVLQYEAAAQASSLLLASDSRDVVDFAAISGQLKDALPPGAPVGELVRGSADDPTVRSQLLAALNQGQKVVNYLGHGSVNMWRGSLLTNEDALGLSNGQKLPLFVLMTCLNGYFDDPALDSLAESLLRAPAGGGVAVWASSAMCDPLEQAMLNQEFYRVLFGSMPVTIGEAARLAKPATGDRDVRRTWILFGDPAMRLR